jgi:hypothetical protein
VKKVKKTCVKLGVGARIWFWIGNKIKTRIRMATTLLSRQEEEINEREYRYLNYVRLIEVDGFHHKFHGFLEL